MIQEKKVKIRDQEYTIYYENEEDFDRRVKELEESTDILQPEEFENDSPDF